MTYRASVFDAIRALRGGRPFAQMEVAQIDDLLDRLRVARNEPPAPLAGADFMAAAVAHLRAEEGVRRTAYRDHLGYWTIGVGRLIDPRKGGRVTEAERAAIGHDGPPHDGPPHGWPPLTDAQIDLLLANDIARTVEALETHPGLAPAWRAVGGNVARRVALASMAFQMGAQGLAGFTNTLAKVAAGDFAGAARNAAASLWAKQTPARAARVLAMLDKGVAP